MKLLVITVLIVCCFSPLANPQQTINQNQQEARLLVKALASDLKTELSAAMSKGGPIQGVEVCRLRAAPIAKNISQGSGWEVGRTSLKVRNQNNTPDDWEVKILKQFQLRQAEGEDISKMEYSALETYGEQSVFRYMKAIPTKGLCFACHGMKVDSAVTQKIHALYPNDQATGFNINDIRGAFSLSNLNSG